MQIIQSKVFARLNVVARLIKRYTHKIQSVRLFVLGSGKFLSRGQCCRIGACREDHWTKHKLSSIVWYHSAKFESQRL